MNINEKGFLEPQEVIRCSEKDFKVFFIDKLHSESNNRNRKWTEYCDFISFVKKHSYIQSEFKVWIFGSLVGSYKNPNDIDLVLFLNDNDFANHVSLAAYLKENSSLVFNVQCEDVVSYSDQEMKDLLLNKEGKIFSSVKNEPKGCIEIVYNI